MNEIENIKFAIRKIAAVDKTYSEVCNVKSIDLAASTCDCIPIDGSAILTNVRLNADYKDGFKLIPKLNSVVIVTLINNTTGFISMISEVDEIHLNGISLGGLIKIVEQTAKLNQLVTELQNQLTLIATGIAAGGGSYTPGTLSQFNKTDYENTTILQGNGS